MKVSEAKIVDIKKITDIRGNLSVVEGLADIPFDIKRVYWVYDVPGGECRGGHAHKRLKQFLVALSGSFTVTLDDGTDKKRSFSTTHTKDLKSRLASGERLTTSLPVPYASYLLPSFMTKTTTSVTITSFWNT